MQKWWKRNVPCSYTLYKMNKSSRIKLSSTLPRLAANQIWMYLVPLDSIRATWYNEIKIEMAWRCANSEVLEHAKYSYSFCLFFSIPQIPIRQNTMRNHFQSLMRCSSAISSDNAVKPTSAVTDEPCSGRGDCLNGTCLCEIRYSGDECDNFNLPYHAGNVHCFQFVLLLLLFIYFIITNVYCLLTVYFVCLFQQQKQQKSIGHNRKRCFICILFRGSPIHRTIANMLYGRISTTKAAIIVEGAAIDNTEITVFCCIHSGTITWCLLHNTSKCTAVITTKYVMRLCACALLRKINYVCDCIWFYCLQEALQPDWASILISAYYPLLLTCSSLVVCLWAEVRHLIYCRNAISKYFTEKWGYFKLLSSISNISHSR